MDRLVLFNDSELKKLLNKRSAESKFGEHVKLLTNVSNIYDQLKSLDVEYVVFGIPEDVGVFANHGKSGACNAWTPTIKTLINIQSNRFTYANKVLILGHLDFQNEMEVLKTLDQNKKKDVQKARVLVKTIDKHVSHLVYNIIKAGKTPIIIGGGHNNAYGNIKGSSLALNKKLNVVNLDAHSDFRKEEGRHSGNGFSYAYSEGFLKNYFIFGMHENYTSENLFKTINKIKDIQYNTFESIMVRQELKFKKELKRALNHVNSTSFGIEIDCDSIENIPSSAMTPSGFSTTRARQFLDYFAKSNNVVYLHLCEAAPKKKQQAQVAKLLTYLITDFIKSHQATTSS